MLSNRQGPLCLRPETPTEPYVYEYRECPPSCPLFLGSVLWFGLSAAVQGRAEVEERRFGRSDTTPLPSQYDQPTPSDDPVMSQHRRLRSAFASRQARVSQMCLQQVRLSSGPPGRSMGRRVLCGLYTVPPLPTVLPFSPSELHARGVLGRSPSAPLFQKTEARPNWSLEAA